MSEAATIFDVLRIMVAHGEPYDLTGKRPGQAMQSAIDEGYIARIDPLNRKLYVLTVAGEEALRQLLALEEEDLAAAAAMSKRQEAEA